MASVGGPILFGYCLDIFLYGILTVQTYLYYLAFPQDRNSTKSVVYFIYIIGTLQTALALRDFYTLFCTLQGNQFLESSLPDLVFDIRRFGFMWFTIPVGDALVASAVQLFYAHRIYMITKAKIVTAIVLGLASLQFIFSILSAPLFFGNGLQRFQLPGLVTLLIGGVSSAVCDVFIAIYMAYYLAVQMRGASKNTQVLVTKIVRIMLETGILTAAMALAHPILASFTMYGVMIPGLSLGKLYGNSMLVLLNNRFTILDGRNAQHPDFDIPSYRRPDLVEGTSTGPAVSHSIAFAHTRPAETAVSGGEVYTIRLNPPQRRESLESEDVSEKKAEAGNA